MIPSHGSLGGVDVQAGQPASALPALPGLLPAGAGAIDPRARPVAITHRHTAVITAVVAIVTLALVPVLLAARSDHVEFPTATALYYGYLVAVSLLVGLYWFVRRPESTFGLLLGAFGLTTWVVSWQSSDWPLAFDIGVLAEAPFFILTFWLFLAFPTGKLRTLSARLIVGFAILAALAFFVPWALLTPVIAGAGPLAGCRPSCPANVLQLATEPGAMATLGRLETYAMLALVIAVLGVYWVRITHASRPQRRALVAVAVSSLLFLPIFFAFHFSREILHADPAILEPMSWALIGIRVILPLGFLAALIQSELYAGAVRGQLLKQLLGRPSPQEWRTAVAAALDDPHVQVGYWDPTHERYREPDGSDLPAAGPGRSIVEATRDGEPAAAMVLDDALAEDPELVRAATSATVLAVANGNLEGELRASRTRVREVGAAERKRIEANLHDSAQQRLVALRINLERTADRLKGPEQRAVRQFGVELERVLEDLRSATTGGQPRDLSALGAAFALKSLARSAAVAVSVEDHGFGRRSELIESTVFFTCAEALQNATKHAGPDASVAVRLGHGEGSVRFSVEDDGAGFDLPTVRRGLGLDNMRDRVVAAGGTLAIESTPGRGTRVRGRLPDDA